jgi:hypothetical protein
MLWLFQSPLTGERPRQFWAKRLLLRRPLVQKL